MSGAGELIDILGAFENEKEQEPGSGGGVRCRMEKHDALLNI